MRDTPTISIVVPAYNAADHIGSLLDSLVPQTVSYFEVIVVDDGSDDDLESVLEAHEVDIRSYRQDNQGPSAARNTGSLLARGQYLAFLDADDLVSPNWVETFVKMSATEAATLHCGMRVVNLHESGRERYRRPHRMSQAFYGLRGLFLPGAYAIRRDLFQEIGGFEPSIRYGEHTELALRLAGLLVDSSNPSTTVDQPLVTKMHDRRAAKRESYQRARLEGAEYVLSNHRKQLSHDPSLLANYHAVAAVAGVGLGDRSLARGHFRAAAGVRSGNPVHLLRAVISRLPVVGMLYWRRHLGKGISVPNPEAG